MNQTSMTNCVIRVRTIGVGLLGIFAAVFIPSESTMIKMMLAKYATVDNVQAVYQAILDGAKYILEGLK